MKNNRTKCVDFTLSKHKVLELQFSRWEDAPAFDFDFIVRRKHKSDHAGFQLDITVFHHELMVHFYDTRHKDQR